MLQIEQYFELTEFKLMRFYCIKQQLLFKSHAPDTYKTSITILIMTINMIKIVFINIPSILLITNVVE